MTVCILGAGDLGGAIAHALARGGHARRILLVDPNSGIAAGKALDISQSGAIAAFHAELAGTDDVMRITGTAVCVVADRAGKPSAEWHGDEALAMLTRVVPYLGGAPVVFAGAAQADLLLALAREVRVRRERLIGSGPVAFASAVAAIVAAEARCSPAEVMLPVLGVPAGFVIAWSEASVGGYALERTLGQAQIARLEARAARLWPLGPFALGLAAARVADAVLTSARRAFGVLTVLGGEFGVRDRVGTLPVLLSSSGIVHVRVPSLNSRERVQLETSLGL